MNPRKKKKREFKEAGNLYVDKENPASLMKRTEHTVLKMREPNKILENAYIKIQKIV